MKLYLVGKSNKCPPFIDDENRKTTPKRHKWTKGLLLTNDESKGSDDTRFPLTRENFCISDLSSLLDGEIEEMIDSISQGIFPIVQLHFMNIFSESSVSAVDHITKRELKSSIQYTCTSTNVDLDPESFPRGIEDLIDMIENIDFRDIDD